MGKKIARGTQRKARKGPPARSPTRRGTQAKAASRKIVLWSIDRIKPYARNARRHSATQIEQLRASFRRFGWTIPLLVREDGTLIAGHGRFEAAKLEGFKEVPVIIATGWSEEQCRAYALADNRLAEGSDWDKDLLSIEIQELSAIGGFDLGSDLGFSEKEIVRALKPDGVEGGTEPQLEGGLIYSVVVRCKDEAQQRDLLEQLEKQGLTCEALMS